VLLTGNVGRRITMPPVSVQGNSAAMQRRGRVAILRTPSLPSSHQNIILTTPSEDCAPGTCYEGACLGDKRYSTDGTCGPRGDDWRMCAGKWGDCCSLDGVCGTGDEFCSMCTCSSGNCSRPTIEPPIPLWALGNTTDGTCGGEGNITCSSSYGVCCTDGVCGHECGERW
jgi:hypothetical protein